jgi:hypothetical protein
MIIPIVEGRSWVYRVNDSTIDTLKYVTTDIPGPDGLGGWYIMWWASDNNDVEEEENLNYVIAKYTEMGVVNCLAYSGMEEFDIFGRKATMDTPGELLFPKDGEIHYMYPYLMVQYPIEVGETWDMCGKLQGYIIECCDLSTDIEVEAGSFSSVLYETTKSDFTGYLEKRYYTPGIGLIAHFYRGQDLVQRAFYELLSYE